MTTPPTQEKKNAEYLLRVARHVNERTQRPCILVQLTTASSFAHFRYELAVDDRMEGNTLHLRVLGLKAPRLDLPASGPAEFRKEFEGWQGKHQIIVYGLDGTSATVGVTITPGTIALARPAPPGIVDLEEPPPTSSRSHVS
jgi:hypothetical protein